MLTSSLILGGGYVIKGTELFFVIGSYSDLEDARTEVIVDYDSPGAAPLPIFSHVPEGWHRRDARIRAGISKLKVVFRQLEELVDN